MILLIILPIICLAAGFIFGAGSAWIRPRWLGLNQRDGGNACAAQAKASKLQEIKIVRDNQCYTEDLMQTTTSETLSNMASLPTLGTPSPRPTVDAEDLPQRTPFCSPTTHLGHLVRVASHALDEFESRSVLHRLTSADTTTPWCPPSPSSHVMFTPAAAFPPKNTTNNDVEGVAVPMACHEVHMDEINLLEKIGGGAFGSVYKGHWRGAPVAVKYVLTRTDNSDSLGRAIREIILSKKLVHPNVVTTYSWTVLSQPSTSTISGDGCTSDSNTADEKMLQMAKRALDPTFSELEERAKSEEFSSIPAVWPRSPPPPSPLKGLADTEGMHGASVLCGVKRRRTSLHAKTTTWTPSPSSLGVAPRMDSFNSEEGFGSPVRRKQSAGVHSVFDLESLCLQPQEALLAVVMEHCELGSLHRALQRRAFLPSEKWPFRATFRALLRTAAEIAKGMEHCHSLGVIHGDLKPGNILLKTHRADRRGYIAKVADFGLSWHVGEGDSSPQSGGTPAFTAPEAFEGNALGKPGDVYAFGVLLWCMYYCTEPFEGMLEAQVCMGVCDGWLRPSFDAACPARFRALAERCWSQSPEERPSFTEIARDLVKTELEFRSQRVVHAGRAKEMEALTRVKVKQPSAVSTTGSALEATSSNSF